jgi:hypothetical protein
MPELARKMTGKRQITVVYIAPERGEAKDFMTINEAIKFAAGCDGATPPLRHEVLIRYDSGDKIEGQFQDKAATMEFLQAYQTGNWTPAIESLVQDVVILYREDFLSLPGRYPAYYAAKKVVPPNL